MNIQWILHVLAILFGIIATACCLLPSSNKIVLFICFALVAGVFELTIPFLNRSHINNKPEAFVTIHKLTYTENFNQFTANITISTKNAGPIIIRKIGLHFCYKVDFQEPPICTNLLFWQETVHIIIQNNKPFNKTMFFGANAEELRSTLSGYVNIDIIPTIYIEYTTNSGNDKILNEQIGRMRILPNYSGFVGKLTTGKPIKLNL